MLNLAFKIVDYASNDFPLVKIYSVCARISYQMGGGQQRPSLHLVLYTIYYDDDDVTAQGRGGVDNGPVSER